MEKREFLKSAAGLAALSPVIAMAADTRRFGVPASVSAADPNQANKLRLSFARSALPTEVWDETLAYVNGVQGINSSEGARQAFRSSPTAYFSSLGARTSATFEKSKEVALAKFVLDPEAKAAAATGDYVKFLGVLKSYEIATLPDPSGLAAKISALLKSDAQLYESVSAAVNTAGTSNPQIAKNAIMAVATAVKPALMESAYISTDTIVVTQVFVSAHISIVTDIAALVTVAAAVLAVVLGDDPVSDISSLGKLDIQMVEAATAATRASRLLGNSTFSVQVAKDVLSRETEAIMLAAESVGLVVYPPDKRAIIFDAAKEAIFRGAGLS